MAISFLEYYLGNPLLCVCVCGYSLHFTPPPLPPLCVCVCDFWHLATASRIVVAERLAHISHWLRTCTYEVENVYYQPYRLDRLGPVDSPFKYLNKTNVQHGRASLCNLWRTTERRKENNFNLLHTLERRVCYLFIVRLVAYKRIFPFFLFSGVDLILSLMILTLQCLIIWGNYLLFHMFLFIMVSVSPFYSFPIKLLPAGFSLFQICLLSDNYNKRFRAMQNRWALSGGLD